MRRGSGRVVGYTAPRIGVSVMVGRGLDGFLYALVVPEGPSRPSRRRFLQGVAAAAAATGTVGVAARDASAQPAQGHEGRLRNALDVRDQAAAMSAAGDQPRQESNGDERSDIAYAMSFTKGLPHSYRTGLVLRRTDFEQFVGAIETGASSDFRAVPLGPHSGFRTAPDDSPVRGWETPAAGLCFNLTGHDPQSLAMPPAPKAGSDELVGEIAEIYAQAALRDEPLTDLRHDAGDRASRDRMLVELAALPWFNSDSPEPAASPAALRRRRTGLSPQTAFRGLAPGDTVGPYLSQLLLVGSPGTNRGPLDGIIEYGAQTIDQRVRRVAPTDFMTSWDEYFDVANGLSPGAGALDTGSRRFITTGRDLAHYVHNDALYQAYFNAALVMLSNGIGLDPSLPYQQDDKRDHQQGFVLFAMQHVLSLLGEVSDRALKTVLFQKFNVHRRLRPESLAARIEKSDVREIAEISHMADQLTDTGIAAETRRITAATSGTESMLLPMAYAEGSPMHPSYGAGHATVAGACVTILKTLFDHTRPFDIAGDASTAFVATRDGSQLATVDVFDELGNSSALTVEGELNKLAANMSIGRNWAGVHYFSDYWESVLLGEQVAIELLREHMLTIPEPPSLRVPTFGGTRLWL